MLEGCALAASVTPHGPSTPYQLSFHPVHDCPLELLAHPNISSTLNLSKTTTRGLNSATAFSTSLLLMRQSNVWTPDDSSS